MSKPNIQKLVNMIKEKYDAMGILLAGSAATGTIKPHSDIDFFCVWDNAKKETLHFDFEGHKVDVMLRPIEVYKKEVTSTYFSSGITDAFAEGKILYDPKAIMKELKEKAKSIRYSKEGIVKYLETGAISVNAYLLDAEDLLKENKLFEALMVMREGADLLAICILKFFNSHKWYSKKKMIPVLQKLDPEYFDLYCKINQISSEQKLIRQSLNELISFKDKWIKRCKCY